MYMNQVLQESLKLTPLVAKRKPRHQVGNSQEDTVVRPGVRGTVITTAAALFFTPRASRTITGAGSHGPCSSLTEGVGWDKQEGGRKAIHLDDSSQGKVTNFQSRGTFLFCLFLPSSPGEGMGG